MTLSKASFIFACFLGGVSTWGLTQAEQALLREVMPKADTFYEREGQPPVFKAYRTDPESGEQKLVGYVFLTSDVPPEELGYSGPIRVLVGMDLEGTLTGVRVLSYREAIARILGDFLRRPGFQEQFVGKHISDPFRVGRDVDGITRATISVGAMARGIRNAARRVSEAYLQEWEAASPRDPPAAAVAITLEQLERLSWPQMLSSRLVTNITISSGGLVGLDLSFAYIGNETLGRLLLGPSTYVKAQKEVGARAQDHHLMVLGLDGTYVNLFEPENLAIQQGTESFPLTRDDFIFLGEPREGKIAGQVLFIGVLLIEQAVDITQPFTILYDLRPAMGLFSNEYSLPADVLALVQERSSPVLALTAAPSVPEPLEALPQERSDAGLAPAGDGAPRLAFSVVEEETVLSRLLTEIHWTRVVPLLILFALVMYAFLRKSTGVRWVALAYTLVYLGFVDGGFLSISHITSGLKVGPSVYLNDLPLLLVVGFTTATTLLWGRVFCGFLCPFGALQDFLERVVPNRFQVKIPQRIHDRALYIKYGILALIVALALARSDGSLYQYFEPFGTVFFLSTSVLLWVIASGFLVASAIVPRFYCRYVCPLGAAIGLASFLTLFRIKRVDACKICKVCEHSCPTGAIRGPKIDFKECVRCDICEVKLMARAGVCRHRMEEGRVRLKE